MHSGSRLLLFDQAASSIETYRITNSAYPKHTGIRHAMHLQQTSNNNQIQRYAENIHDRRSGFFRYEFASDSADRGKVESA